MIIELKKVEIKTAVKCSVFVFLLMGFVIGTISFIYTLFTQSLNVGGILVGILAILLYSLIFTIVASLVIILLVVFYNLVAAKVGGVKISSDLKENKNNF